MASASRTPAPTIIPFPTAVAAARDRLRRSEARARVEPERPHLGFNVVAEWDYDAVEEAIRKAETDQVERFNDRCQSRPKGYTRAAECWREEPDVVIWSRGHVMAIVRNGAGRRVNRLWGADQ